MKKNGWLCGLLLILCCGCPGAYSDDFVLVKDGKPQAAVVKNRRIAETQRFLIREAGKCGVQLDLTAPAKSGNQIVFEVSDMTLETEDSFTIDFPDPRTMKIVCSPVSARWAVDHLLETAFGVRWLFPHKAKTKT